MSSDDLAGVDLDADAGTEGLEHIIKLSNLAEHLERHQLRVTSGEVWTGKGPVILYATGHKKGE